MWSVQIGGHPRIGLKANGTSAHSLELDDVVNEGSCQSFSSYLPAAFLPVFSTSISKEIIEGVILGYEVMVRLAMALDPSAH